MMKVTHVELLPYLALKTHVKMNIYMYYMIYQIYTYTDTWSQSQSVQRQKSRMQYYKKFVYSWFEVISKKEDKKRR